MTMEKLFQFQWDDHWKRLTASTNLIDHFLLLLLFAMGLTLCLTLTADAQVTHPQSSPREYPHYDAPSVLPDVPGPRIYLMPDGGTWTVIPNVLPGMAPPPIYNTPPDNDRRPEDFHIYIHNGRPRRF
jgi:hypothetical protein